MEGISVILSQLRPELAALLLFGTALIGYLLGNCNGAVMVSKLLFHDDVRTHGSGNGGLTNFHRTYGGKWVTIVVIAVDMLKVVIAVYLSVYIFRRYMPNGYVPLFVKYWAGIWTVVGHVFPFALKFHGGKGILAGGTLALLVDWRVAVCAWGCFLIGVIITRWVSFGSILAATAFGVSSALFHPVPSIAIPALLAGALIDWKHRENAKRIRAGTESKLTFKKKAPPPAAVPKQPPAQQPGQKTPVQKASQPAPAKAKPAQPQSAPAPAAPMPPQKQGITEKIVSIPVPASALQKETPQGENTAAVSEGQVKSEGNPKEDLSAYLEKLDVWLQDHPEEPVKEPEQGKAETTEPETPPEGPEAEPEQVPEEEKQEETP